MRDELEVNSSGGELNKEMMVVIQEAAGEASEWSGN